MNYQKLNGIWKGHYSYGDMYPKSYWGRLEPFTLDIVFKDVNFKGVCIDRFTNEYFNSPATVEGTFVPNMISFIKKYPSLLTVNDKMEPIVQPDKPSLEIHYTGLFYKGLFSKTIRFEGEWSMTGYSVLEHGKREYYTCSGKWVLKK